jgi:hypothetical protein
MDQELLYTAFLNRTASLNRFALTSLTFCMTSNSLAPRNPIGFQGRRHSETDGFLSAGGICHDQICGKRVEVSSGAFCTRVIAFKIYCKIYALHRVIPSFAVRYFAFFSLSISF